MSLQNKHLKCEKMFSKVGSACVIGLMKFPIELQTVLLESVLA